MRDKVEEFFSRLQTVHLKPKGYRKQRHTFTRDLQGFTERVQVQGSAWNDRNSPWRFYLNFGIQFHGLPSRSPDRDLPGTHCWARIDSLVPGAPREFEISGEDDNMALSLASFIGQEASPSPRLSLP